MPSLIKYLFSLIAALVCATSSFAATATAGDGYEFQTDRSAPTIVFINGIKNTSPMTAASSQSLILSLRTNGLPQGKYNYTYFWNPTDGLIGDDSELMKQAKISDQILALTSNNKDEYYRQLGIYYNNKYAALTTLSGEEKRVVQVAYQIKTRLISLLAITKGVVVVSHSQGNFYIEAAFAMLRADGRLDLTSRIRVVGVAVVAATTPNDRYITHTGDNAIILQYTQTHNTGLGGTNLLNYQPLNALAIPCIITLCGSNISWGAIDPLAHGFQEVYLNSGITNQATGETFPKIIYRSVASSIQELEAYTASLLSEDFNATALDSSIWTPTFGPGSISVANGQATFGAGSYAVTQNKRTFSGQQITIETRFAGTKSSGRDTNISLVDTATGEMIRVGDTNYFSWGLYIQGTGRYNLTGTNNARGANTSGLIMETNGVSVSTMKVVRFSINGTTITVQRGDAQGAYTETLQRTLGASVLGRSFYLMIGTGAPDGVYSPATFDWITAATQ